MGSMKFLLLFLVSCATLPNLAPDARTSSEQMKSLVYLESACADEYETWHTHKFGMGVSVNDRYVVTAAHVVTCPELPYVHATFTNGKTTRLVVVKDDVLFGSGKDIALLEERSAQNFGFGLGPVIVAPDYTGPVIVFTRNGNNEGTLYGNFVNVGLLPGDSGSPVWTPDGRLVGIVTDSWLDLEGYSVGAEVQRLDLGWRF